MVRVRLGLAALAATLLLGACDGAIGPTISGSISMPSELQQQLGESDTLYIIAQPAGQPDGPPLAVKRIVGATFPCEYRFDQQDVMVPGKVFEGELTIKARINKSGMATVKVPGDMEGVYAKNPVKVGTGGVDFAIDRLVK